MSRRFCSGKSHGKDRILCVFWLFHGTFMGQKIRSYTKRGVLEVPFIISVEILVKPVKITGLAGGLHRPYIVPSAPEKSVAILILEVGVSVEYY